MVVKRKCRVLVLKSTKVKNLRTHLKISFMKNLHSLDEVYILNQDQLKTITGGYTIAPGNEAPEGMEFRSEEYWWWNIKNMLWRIGCNKY